MKITFAHCNLLDGNENMILQKNVNIIVENEKIHKKLQIIFNINYVYYHWYYSRINF